MDNTVFWLAFVLPVFFTVVFTLVGGILIVAAMKQRSLTMEMKHRERMAMIEKGIVPEPGRDPAAFEAWQQRHDRPPSRSMSIGVMIVAIGLAFMVLVGFAGNEPGAGIGVGGAIAVVGLAFVVNGALQRSAQPPPPPRY